MGKDILDDWSKANLFEKSVTFREGSPSFTFYEGPPSANGMPGIHHVMARTIKDIFCRYKTLKGFQVKRKGGWDTHGLPVELAVEKELGITKEDIGGKITIAEYNQKCREAVMKYTAEWTDITKKMGYWVDMEDPYVTYDNKYIESVWWILAQMHKKDLLYKGYSIQPYSPKAGTGLSSHELNLPGCYKDVKDQTCVAQFKLKETSLKKETLGDGEMCLLAWTTTPWTLPSNTALAVNPNITYVMVRTFNRYTGLEVQVVLAEALLEKHFTGKFVKAESESDFDKFSLGDKGIPFEVIAKYEGYKLEGLEYEQLLPYTLPYENTEGAFKVIPGAFVTTEDGTGIVHIAPTFGADDMFVAQEAGVPPMLVLDDDDNPVPLVDLQGRFVKQMGSLAGKYVKNEYYDDGEAPEKSVDVEIVIKLKEENKCFITEKYEHNYPHCWRTDKPILYYPLDSWFVRASAAKKRMSELNDTINWKPASTGTGRFGEWLSNLHDWNLSRSRYWGIPLPVWRTEDGKEEICISSMEELKTECEKSVAAGVMEGNPLTEFSPGNYSKENYSIFDLHRPYVDDIFLISDSGKPMKREMDLIDVWFDSGSMPYAQAHYPFENKDDIDLGKAFPADYIAEGVDQTRGWFYTLHAIATMCFDSVAYKNVISNGLVLDKTGQKMSKRLGNAADPFEILEKYGADSTRWYMITNAQPWDNLKFNENGIGEARRKFFGTLFNTYAFYALYANIDDFHDQEEEVPLSERPEIDRWIISLLNSLIKEVDQHYSEYEPTRAGRAIQKFVDDNMSNWYVRLCRRRFWKGEYSKDKIAAYQTLRTCLSTIAQMSSPIAPFFMDRLYIDLNNSESDDTSVHLSDFPVADEGAIDMDLEERMQIAQNISSLVLSLRKREGIKVRQPLQKIMVPVLNKEFNERLKLVENLILSEVNVKELDYLLHDDGVFSKKIKPNFKALGPRYGKHMKAIAVAFSEMKSEDIETLEQGNTYELTIADQTIQIGLEDVEITSEDIPGWLVSSMGGVTVALDISITEELKEEGIARDLVNKIQNLRKLKNLEVTDKITVQIKSDILIDSAINNNLNYICSETLATSLEVKANIAESAGELVEVNDEISAVIALDKV